jgi:hypothetical protein
MFLSIRVAFRYILPSEGEARCARKVSEANDPPSDAR